MKITQIEVNAGRCFNHPYEQYSNLRPEVRLIALVEDGEDALAAARNLQQQAETLVEDHKRAMLESLEEIQQMRIADQELSELGRTMGKAQARIDELRRKHPRLGLAEATQEEAQ